MPTTPTPGIKTKSSPNQRDQRTVGIQSQLDGHGSKTSCTDMYNICEIDRFLDSTPFGIEDTDASTNSISTSYQE